jgi:hypothetical protein
LSQPPVLRDVVTKCRRNIQQAKGRKKLKEKRSKKNKNKNKVKQKE